MNKLVKGLLWLIGILLVILIGKLLIVPHNASANQDNQCHHECATPTPTPTPSPSGSPSPTPTPSPFIQPTPDGTASFNTTFTAPSCTDIKFTPTVVAFDRKSPTDVEIFWTPVDSGITSYSVSYGLDSNANNWSTIVNGSDNGLQSVDLNSLPANQSIWVKVAGVSAGGCLGSYSQSIDP